MSIKFKKLVWTQMGEDARIECKTPIAEMEIFFHQEDLGTYYFVLRIDARESKEKFRFGTVDECKRKAEEWFESLLNEYIENSENPAR